MKTSIFIVAASISAIAAKAFQSFPARAERVCTKERSEGAGRQRCVERDPDRDRDHLRIKRHDEHHDDRPGVELRAPGVGVDIGH